MSSRISPRGSLALRTVGLAATTAALVFGTGVPATAVTAGQDYQFDFQCAGNPVAEGYTAVLPTTTWSAGGAGFVTPLASTACRNRATGTDPETRDFVLPVITPAPTGATSSVFRASVPDGTYTVVIRTGDVESTSNTGFIVNGVTVPAQSTASRVIGERVVDNVQVTGGQLEVRFTGTSTRINSLQILRPVAAPQAVTSTVVARADAASVTLGWDAVGNAVGYRVFRSTAGAAPVAVADVAPGAAPSWTDTGVQLADDYTYQVASLSSRGLESERTQPLTVSVVNPAATRPAAPTGLKGAWTDAGVALSWTAVPDAVAYDVYRSRPGREPVRVTRVQGTSWADTTAQRSADYSYRVAAVAPGGRSDLSAPVEVAHTVTLVRQAERLDRAPVAVATDAGVYVGWRLLGLDAQDLAFHVYRDGTRITSSPVTGATNLLDPQGTATSVYRIATAVGGVERWASEEFTVWDDQTLDVPLNKPAGGTTPDGVAYEYRANDASIGDVDGDGDYEIVLKWDPSNSKDNSQTGYTGNVYVDAYELDGTQLWRIDLGKNIRAGAHYTQFQVFDYDGDGRAEVAMKTADGTVDGAGTVIGDAAKDYRTTTPGSRSLGYVLNGPEFLTMFEGATGKAVHTVPYTPDRGNVAAWGDDYGNRVDRFLAGTAYLDGQRPSLIAARGYYTRMAVVAYDFDGTKLIQKWNFDTNTAGKQYEHNGNHNLSVADVDGDQKDEIVLGSLTLDHDGSVLNNTGLGHGDTLHLSDFDPSRPGMELFAAHEVMSASGNRGATYRDAETGQIIWSIPATRDTGRAVMADIDPTHPGAEGWAVGGDAAFDSPVGELRAASGELISTAIPAANFVTWWDGDLVREIGDQDYDATVGAGTPTISKWNPATKSEVEIYRAEGTLTGNGTKGNPALQADLFGDWREEIVTRTTDSTALRISTTVDRTDHRLRTLQSDPVYRLGVAWQNTGYNQPPHTSYFLGQGMTTPPAPVIAYTGTDPGPAQTVVPWSVKGFYAPIDMGGVVNTVKAGSTIPLKFEVFAGDREITNPAEVKVATQAVSCSTTAPTDEIELTATGNTALRYDTTSGQFLYTWKTPTTAGTCYAVTATAADGTATTAYVKTR